jgi:hypothetical protein
MSSPDIPHLKNEDEFFPSPRQNHILQDVQQEIRKSQQSLLDESQLRQQEDWSFLKGRVVGAERE